MLTNKFIAGTTVLLFGGFEILDPFLISHSFADESDLNKVIESSKPPHTEVSTSTFFDETIYFETPAVSGTTNESAHRLISSFSKKTKEDLIIDTFHDHMYETNLEFINCKSLEINDKISCEQHRPYSINRCHYKDLRSTKPYSKIIPQRKFFYRMTRK
jgi:hypothetical protein